MCVSSPRSKKIRNTTDNNKENLSFDISMYPVGLAPKSNFQQAQADMLAGVISDLENKLSAAASQQDQDKKARALNLCIVYSGLFRL